jgi:hypothetical protein
MAGLAAKGCWFLWTLALGALLLTGCREDEQDRPLLYDKGTYLGKTEPPLDPQDVEQLRARAQHQKY